MRNYSSYLFCSLVLATLVLSPMPVRATENYDIQHYEWNFKESGFPPVKWSWDLNISNERLNGYKEFSQNKRRNYGYMITTKDGTLKEAAESFRNASQKKGYTGQSEVSFVLSFVQSLEYTSDKVTTGYDEYPRFPLETLADRGGDCEDSSILFATLVILLGYDAVLLVIPGTFDNPGHMGVGVSGNGLSGSFVTYKEVDYYYAETTGLDWKIGVLPPEYETSEMRVVEFTGEQYDPTMDDDAGSLLERFIDQYPGRFVFVVFLFLILIFLIYRLISRNIAVHKENGSRDFFPSDDERGYSEEDAEPWEKSDSDRSRAISDRGPFFYDSTEDSQLSKKKEIRHPSASTRCPRCSSYLWYISEQDDWWCDRCGSVPGRIKGGPPSRQSDPRYEDFEY